MAYGLIGMGNQQRDVATNLIGAAADREQKRENFNENMKIAERAAQLQTVGMGAGIGGSIAAANIAATQGGLAAAGGMAALGPIAIGAIAAYALTELF
jgi:hypothetical protein